MRLGKLAALFLAFILAAPAGAQAQSAYDGLKKTVSVDPFQTTDSVGGAVTADGMTALLTDALARDGRFIVVERPGLASVQAEQALGTATNPDTAAQGGSLIGASAIVRGSVTKFEAAAGGSNIGIGGIPMGSILSGRAGLKTQKAVMEISLRLIDTTTGQVISTSKAMGSASSSGADVGVVNNNTGLTAGGNAFRASPIGKAGEDAVVKAVALIASDMRRVPWSALVVDASGPKVYVNAGTDRNVQAGMEFNVYRKGKVFTDPSTGVVLDVELDTVGVVRIDAVRDRLSTASVVSGNPPARGDVLKLQ